MEILKLNYGIIDNAVEDMFIINSLPVQKSNTTVEIFAHHVKQFNMNFPTYGRFS
jgi:hypothetical protein